VLCQARSLRRTLRGELGFARPAPDAGVVEAVLISDGQPVEYGEALLVIK